MGIACGAGGRHETPIGGDRLGDRRAAGREQAQAARQHYQRRHHGKADRDDHQDDAARGANTGDPPGVSSISRDSHNGVLPVADGTATLSMKSSDQPEWALIEALTTGVALCCDNFLYGVKGAPAARQPSGRCRAAGQHARAIQGTARRARTPGWRGIAGDCWPRGRRPGPRLLRGGVPARAAAAAPSPAHATTGCPPSEPGLSPAIPGAGRALLPAGAS